MIPLAGSEILSPVRLRRRVKIHCTGLDSLQRCFSELQNCGRISISHVSVGFRGFLQNTFFESSKNMIFQKKFIKNEFLKMDLGHFENRSVKKNY